MYFGKSSKACQNISFYKLFAMSVLVKLFFLDLNVMMGISWMEKMNLLVKMIMMVMLKDDFLLQHRTV